MAHSSMRAAGKSHPVLNFVRHFVEMCLVMVVGMLAAGVVFWTIFGSASGLTFEETSLKAPVPLLLLVAIGMTVPMVAWMRLRGHGWRVSGEMAAAMMVPVIPFLFLAWFDILKGTRCSLYCVVTIPAMIIAMLFRRNEYSMDHGHHAHHHEHVPA